MHVFLANNLAGIGGGARTSWLLGRCDDGSKIGDGGQLQVLLLLLLLRRTAPVAAAFGGSDGGRVLDGLRYSIVLPDGHKVDGRFHHHVQIAKVGLEVRVSVPKEDATASILEKEGVAVGGVPSKEGHGKTDIWCRHPVAEEEALFGEEQIQLGELVVHALASGEDGLVLDAAVDEEAQACLVHAVEESVVDV